MAFRREVLTSVGGFDEKFRWYRTADIDWSFRVKDAGLGCSVVPLPVTKHEHRAWRRPPRRNARHGRSGTSTGSSIGTAIAVDLVLSGEPDDHDHDHEPEHHHEGPVTMPDGR